MTLWQQQPATAAAAEVQIIVAPIMGWTANLSMVAHCFAIVRLAALIVEYCHSHTRLCYHILWVIHCYYHQWKAWFVDIFQNTSPNRPDNNNNVGCITLLLWSPSITSCHRFSIAGCYIYWAAEMELQLQQKLLHLKDNYSQQTIVINNSSS